MTDSTPSQIMDESGFPVGEVKPDKIKQVIVMRTDLNMRKGKMVAQGALASMIFLSRSIGWIESVGAPKGDMMFQTKSGWIKVTQPQKAWLEGAFTKVCVGAGSAEELETLRKAASAAGIVAYIMVDNGETEFGNVKTPTCLALGPDYASRIDPITRHLKLL